MSDREEKHTKREAQEVKEILGVVSTEIPALIKGLLSSVFSEEAGTSMGKAAAAYYKQLKEGGLPEAVAVKLTEDYMRTFTSLGDMLRGVGKGNWSQKVGDDLRIQIGKKVRDKVDKKIGQALVEEEEDQNEDED
jgi:hypothetical protein